MASLLMSKKACLVFLVTLFFTQRAENTDTSTFIEKPETEKETCSNLFLQKV